jgi:hypothetical protein
MWKTSTLCLTCLLCLFSLVGVAQSTKTQPLTEGGSKIVKAYPNPASSKITFQIQQHNNGNNFGLIVYNFLGKKVDEFKNINSNTTVDLGNYYSGVYIFQLRDERGNLVESGKFNVVK